MNNDRTALMSRRFGLRQFILAAGFAAAAAHAQTLPAGAVAVVNGATVTESQLQRAVSQSGLPDTSELRQAMKSQLIARELFRQQAIRNKVYDSRPEVKQAMQEAKDLAISQLYLRDAIKPAAVTEEGVRARYDAAIASLGDREYKPSIIKLADEATAKTVLDQIKSGADFGQLALQYSLAPNKVNRGAMEWMSFRLPPQEGKTVNIPLPLAQALVQLPEGAVAPAPVSWDNAYYLVRLDQVRPTRIPQYDEVKATLRRMQEAQALEKATAALVADLLKDARIIQ